MTDVFFTSRSGAPSRAFRSDRGSAARVAADWLCLAATPTFAIMALLGALGGGPPDMLCAAMAHASPFGGMTSMYLLMSVFHASPWLKLIGGR
jgi:hypothetical protein